ncbi:MAG: protein kinase [Ruminococcus sp.]|nr:protein kinase [Ruminococcus sp.]
MYKELCPNCFRDVDVSTGVCEHCGYDQKLVKKRELAIEPINILNARYLVGKVLGQGGFGITYFAKDMMENKYVAIKECIPESYVYRDRYLNVVVKEGCEQGFEQCRYNFQREISTLYKFRGNPYIVNVCDYFSENDTDYFVMDYIDGVTLKYLSNAQGGTISYENALLILLYIGSTILEVHRNNFIHRDISPENIMVSKDGKIKLIDFGACRDYTEEEEDSEIVFLKPGFAPPEQYENGSNQGPWTDIYALGATFYSLVSGLPMSASVDRIENDTMRPLKEINSDVSEIVSDAIQCCMETDISKRYKNIEDFLNQIYYDATNVSEIDSQTLWLIKQKQESEYKNSEFNSQLIADKHPCVRIDTGNNQGHKEKIPEYTFLSVGRDSRVVNICLKEFTSISRQHCLIGFDTSRESFIVIDQSSNGTYFSDHRRMERGEYIYLDPGESIFIGSDACRLTLLLE